MGGRSGPKQKSSQLLIRMGSSQPDGEIVASLQLMRKNTREALQLCLLVLVNYLLFYSIGVFLAPDLTRE